MVQESRGEQEGRSEAEGVTLRLIYVPSCLVGSMPTDGRTWAGCLPRAGMEANSECRTWMRRRQPQHQKRVVWAKEAK